MKKKHEKLLERIQNEEDIDIEKNFDELIYLDSEDYIDAIVFNEFSEHMKTLSQGAISRQVQDEDAVGEVERIELKRAGNDILKDNEFHEERNKILVASSILSATITIVLNVVI